MLIGLYLSHKVKAVIAVSQANQFLGIAANRVQAVFQAKQFQGTLGIAGSPHRVTAAIQVLVMHL